MTVSKAWRRDRLRIASLILPPMLAVAIFVVVWLVVG